MSDEREAVPPLAEDIEVLLRTERRAPPPALEASIRLRARLQDTLHLGLPAPPVLPHRALGVSKLALAGAFVLGAVSGGAGVSLLPRAPEPPMLAATESRPDGSIQVRAADAEAQDAGQAVVGPPAEALEPRQKPRGQPAAGVLPAEAQEKERALLERARVALARGHPDQAQHALREHQRRYPAGSLGEEREALWILALHAQGEVEAARAQASRFHAKYPDSLFWLNLEAKVLGSDDRPIGGDQ